MGCCARRNVLLINLQRIFQTMKLKNQDMDSNDFESVIRWHVEKMRPEDEEIRKKLDIRYSFEKNVLLVFEISPCYGDETRICQYPFVKARWVIKRQIWKIYWLRANGNWELYEPKSQVKTLKEFFKVLNDDAYDCFFG
jgi:ribosomal protein S24E